MRALLLAALVACSSDAPTEPPAADPDVVLTEVLFPKLPGAKPMRAPQVRNNRDISASWCIDDANVIPLLAKQLGSDGWTMIETRDRTTYHVMSARRDRLQFQATLRTGDDRCGGTVAHLMIVKHPPALF